jgi:hypothetical protein
MKKAILALALWLLASSALAQQGLYCGMTGFNTNTGGAGGWRCAPSIVQRGSGAVALNATTTATNALGGFSAIAPIDAVAAADGTFFRTSAIIVRGVGANSATKIYRVSAKASSTSITILEGAATPGVTGSFTDWSYWNTTCYRTTAATVAFTDAALVDPRIWGKIGEDSPGRNQMPLLASPHAFLSYTLDTSATALSLNAIQRPSGLALLGGSSATLISAPSLVAGQSNMLVPSTQLATGGLDIQMQVAQGATNNYFAFCVARLIP